MADVVKVVPPTLLEASSQVAQHIEVAAKPPTAAAPPPAAASPGSAWRDGLLLAGNLRAVGATAAANQRPC